MGQASQVSFGGRGRWKAGGAQMEGRRAQTNGEGQDNKEEKDGGQGSVKMAGEGSKSKKRMGLQDEEEVNVVASMIRNDDEKDDNVKDEHDVVKDYQNK
jgi:hypothetical protein